MGSGSVLCRRMSFRNFNPHVGIGIFFWVLFAFGALSSPVPYSLIKELENLISLEEIRGKALPHKEETMIDLTINEKQLARNVAQARERNILLPTLGQQKAPGRIPWKNDPVELGGGFNEVNFMEIPPELFGVPARVIALVGKWFLTGARIVMTVWTDSMDLYKTRLSEMTDVLGPYTELDAAKDYHRYLLGESTANLKELTYYDRRQIHNLKYFTWVEQQGRDVEELNAQWYDFPDYWERIAGQARSIDRLIEQFNERATSRS